jgi:hypothetical protein
MGNLGGLAFAVRAYFIRIIISLCILLYGPTV